MIENIDLKTRQGYSLYQKIALSQMRIHKWYRHFKGKVYVSFSGGKDSTVLLHLARDIYPEIPAVFCDTGLEYPEVREFVKSVSNVTWIKPKMPFSQVIKHHGYPIVSKEQAQFIRQYRTAKSQKTKDTRWFGNSWGRGKISEKWKYLVDAPFKISEKCCDVMKKQPFYAYEKETKNHPIIGIMADESSLRVQSYNKYGCNAFDLKRPVSRPIIFWTEKDIWDYLNLKDIKYSSIYDMGYERTGCMFCLFGYHISEVWRLELMKKTHPKQYKYCMENLGLDDVIKWYDHTQQ